MRRAAGLALLLAAACSSKGGGGDDQTPPAPPARDAAVKPPTPPVPGEVVLPPAPPVPPPPLGLPETPSPPDNPTTPEKVVLGELLFFDPRLSRDGTASCASCHDPDQGWADGRPKATTLAGRINLRHTPTLWNVGYAREYFWDGRVGRLETMITANWQGQLDADPGKVAAALARHPVYAAHFERAFGGTPTPERIAQALAAFVRTIRSGDSAWDRYEATSNPANLPAEAVAGSVLFHGRAQCGNCHPPPLYADHDYHSLDIGAGRDEGRARVTGDPADEGAFRTPTVRGAAAHPPYFHDGSAASLEAAIDAILAHGTGAPPVPIQLTAPERLQLVAFVRSLTPGVRPYPRPKLP